MQTKFTEQQLKDSDNFATEKVFKKCREERSHDA